MWYSPSEGYMKHMSELQPVTCIACLTNIFYFILYYILYSPSGDGLCSVNATHKVAE